MKIQFSYNMKDDLKSLFYAMEWFRDFFKPSDLITTFTYVLMDNLCPCLNSILKEINFLSNSVFNVLEFLERQMLCKYQTDVN